MNNTSFVIGGCRSGKSSHALALAEKIPGKRKTFIATCIPCDNEMKKRVKNHQAERSDKWTTVEAPVNLPEAIYEAGKNSDVVLADCLTLWISNLLLDPETSDKINQYIENLINVMKKISCNLIIVSNEVGAGIVPENELARSYRDLVGFANQKVAGAADKVTWTVAGIPVKIK
ncbi:Bifunctional adenosylcobalamin biosynthesis protein [Desulfonema limicola]|uniref:Adenosylcobinamide kinase n=1 Tax=Desulfonema limicola TaxID=45656 RepID=A0A975GGL2_9BACT|nr:bifunctional adenosylcobinamide kinase/adenosylcobinamide-phosphate guanylyltransferase [Desulfonema limicola]QTA80460.1 Bifunctional adenosylcobalamin biosynthesis protein [Desulfonema limicola]